MSSISSSSSSSEPPSTPERLRVRGGRVIAQGTVATVYAVEDSEDGTKLALKAQIDPIDREFIFAKVLEYAQKKGHISKHIRFAPTLKADTSQEHYTINSISTNVLMMPRMEKTLEWHRALKSGYGFKEQEEKLEQHEEKLAKIGFNMVDVQPCNILIDADNKLYFSDYGKCSILPNSLAEKCLEEFLVQEPSYGEYFDTVLPADNVMNCHITQDRRTYNIRARNAEQYYNTFKAQREYKRQQRESGCCSLS